jgi:hypothetical protein
MATPIDPSGPDRRGAIRVISVSRYHRTAQARPCCCAYQLLSGMPRHHLFIRQRRTDRRGHKPAVAAYGYTRGLVDSASTWANTTLAVQEQMLWAGAGLMFETRHCTKGGRTFAVEVARR